MSGSCEYVRRKACVHRLDLGLYSHGEFWGNGVQTHVNSEGKVLYWRLRGGLNPRRRIRQDSQPNTLPTNYSGPHQAGQPAQHTTNQLFRPPSGRTASPTHYQLSYSGPQDVKQPTTSTDVFNRHTCLLDTCCQVM